MSTPEDAAARPDEVADTIDTIIQIRANGVPCEVTTSFLEGIRRRFAAQRATIERLERERDEGFAFKDRTNKALQDCILGEARLKAALEKIAEEHDAGRHDGLPEPCPAHDAVVMWSIARAALSSTKASAAPTGEDRGGR